MAGGPRYCLTVNPGELLTETQTFTLAPKAKTLEALLEAVRAALLPLQPHHQARRRLQEAKLALTVNCSVVGHLRCAVSVAIAAGVRRPACCCGPPH